MPTHHPDQTDLLAYAAGTLPEAKSLLIATHLSFCADCRASVARYEDVGGELLNKTAPAEINRDRISDALAILDGDDRFEQRAVRPSVQGNDLPTPLCDYISGDLNRLPWKKVGAVEVFEFLASNQNIKTRLLKIKRGAAMPNHTHEGSEATLVLSGSFSDQFGRYGPGDVCDVDQSVDHQPIAGDDEDCICLAVSDAPIRLTGTFGRLLNPFVRF